VLSAPARPRFTLRSLLFLALIGIMTPPSAGAQARLLPPYRPAANEPAKTPDDRRFDQMIDEWFAGELQNRPNWATGVGIHAYDAQLDETSRAAVLKRLARSRQFLLRARGIEPNHLSPNRKLDQEIFIAKMRGVALELDTIRSWERNPGTYGGVVSGGLYGLVKRDFAPVDQRLASINARLAQVPRVFADARANLRNPPKIYTEIAIGQTKGLATFLKDLLPGGVEKATDPAAKALFARRNAAAIAATESYAKWLETDLLPRSKGEFRIGKQAYQAKLAYDEMEDESVDSLLAKGYRALADNHRRMVEVAKKIDPTKTPEQVLDEMAQHHPSEDSLLIAARAGLDKIRRFIVDKKILTPPPNQNLNVIETPVFNRSLSFASMDSPGVFEKNANEAYYNVTPVDATWPADKKAEHLGFFNPYQLEVVSIHEAFPGHYYQFLHLKEVPSLVRTLMGSGSNSEGWAHYCEEMAIEQGYGDGDPRYEMAMLNLALQRIGRFIVGIEMHVNGWTQDQGTEFFQKEAYMARVNAEREARRGTSDPTYLVYTLGKWDIQKLRADVQARMGDKFVLGEFHDRLLSMGRTPLSVIRTAFLDPSYGVLTAGGPGAGSDFAR
jgi:uncharacterized protein (DUF885 family)